MGTNGADGMTTGTTQPPMKPHLEWWITRNIAASMRDGTKDLTSLTKVVQRTCRDTLNDAGRAGDEPSIDDMYRLVAFYAAQAVGARERQRTADDTYSAWCRIVDAVRDAEAALAIKRHNALDEQANEDTA